MKFNFLQKDNSLFKTGAAVMVGLVLSGGAVFGQNLALNKPAIHSSIENNDNNFRAAQAVDGNATTTRWSSLFSDPQWIRIDLGANTTFNRVVLKWEAACAKNYKIQVSDDGVNNWTTILEKTDMVVGPRTDDFPVSGSGRYIRMYGTARAPIPEKNNSVYGYSLYEFEVYNIDPGVVMDIDGNVYRTIILGSQEWTLTNLKTTKLNDATPIPNVTIPNANWTGLNTPGYCWYNNDIANRDKYGALYNWHAVKTEKLAPVGWRVPTEADWDALAEFLIANRFNYDGSTIGNKIAKSMAAGAWSSDPSPIIGSIANNQDINNKSCFSGFECGSRDGATGDYFFNSAVWWSSETNPNSTTAFIRYLYGDGMALAQDASLKKCGYSVRLVRDLQ